ncbi:DUF6807 domain-containing protein [Algoriphagus hitonicola]|uniref:Methane oxygenase PmoA n=1 Tax=Algoriphagus hitonicola TaxID=435880 RepID=A0A1I2XAK7_9BACT|nr:PmoA family protein [Algoriphagus hitonicola]SFH10570.1 Methane oxygenase PmoA [Algoriphagus hitonicola]
MSIKRILFGLQFLILVSFSAFGQQVELRESSSGIDFLINSNTVLSYQTATAKVPEGINESFAMSGFIHPLRTLSGQVLTRIQPEDHYHHYGLWGPWTRATIEGRSVDFWNLGDEKGRVDFGEILQKKEESNRALITVSQNHIDLTASAKGNLAMEEELTISLEPIDSNRYVLDYQREFWTMIPSGMVLDQYRYGGGVFIRAVETWGSATSQILTSESKSRDEADASRARWIMLIGESQHASGKSGILILSNPKNHSHPEPLRVWPSDSNGGKGNVFLGFTPIREEEWKLDFGQKYKLNYRLIVFDGELSFEEADAYWSSYVESLGNY